MKIFYCSFLLVLLLGLPLLAKAQYRSTNTPAEVKAREQTIKESPIVFLGRPIQGQYFKDGWGVIYHASVIEVLEVMRGEELIKRGTVELVEPFERQTPELEDAYQFGGTRIYQNMGPEYGIYFCSTSTLPSQKIPYPTANSPLQINKFNKDPNSLIDMSYDLLPGGLYRVWKSEEDLRGYLKRIPNLRALTKSANNKQYPPIKYHDTRPGGLDWYAPRNKKKEVTVEIEPIKVPPIKADTLHKGSNTIIPKNLPIDAMRRLPEVMQRLRSGALLSKEDSVFIQHYLPEYEHTPRPVPPAHIPAGKSTKKVSRLNKVTRSAARAGIGDTLLTMAIQNLAVEQPTLTTRALQGELWLKSNQSGLFMDQLYFEMSTTADLKLDSSPFGQTLVGTYTALPGAPRYSFYQSYDAATKKIVIAAYPAFSNPDRVALSITQTMPFFRFSYTLPDSIPESPLRTVTFTPLTTPASRSYTNYFFSPNPPYPENYSPFHFTAQESVPASTRRPRSLQVDSVRVNGSSVVSAGTGLVVEIYGADFRTLVNPNDATQRGKVRFVDADVAAGSFLLDIDQKDLVSWQDTLIKVVLPSAINAGYLTPHSVGGGPVKVQPYYGKTTQSKPRHRLDIQYNLVTIPEEDSIKTRGYLTSIGCSRGMTFSLSSDLYAVPGLEKTVRAALRAWSVSLGEEFTLSPIPFTGSRSDNDRINVIYYNAALPSGRAMQTNRLSLPSASNVPGIADQKLRWATIDADIAVSTTTNWAYDTTNVSLCPSGTNCPQDFYASLLHEIGHAIGLQHVVDDEDIMFYALSTTRRVKLTTGRQAAVAGALRMIAESKTIRWTKLGTFGEPLASCNTQNRTVNPYYQSPAVANEAVVLFPNPYTDEATILLPPNRTALSEYWVKDGLGRTVAHGHIDSSQSAKIGKGLPAGIYLVHVRTDAKYSTLRMVKSQ